MTSSSDSPPHCNGRIVPARSEYVVVTDLSGEPIEIPTNPDNTIFVSTLQATIAGATGLKYKNPKTGASRAVVVDPSGTKLLPPSDGWEDKVFVVIAANAALVTTPARGSDVSVKRRKMGDSDGDEDSEGEGRLGRKRLIGHNGDRRPADLIVLGLSYKSTDETFKSYFEQFGTVVFAEVKKNSEGASKGFGFVQMATISEQDSVLAVAQHVIDGRRCDVKLPEQRGDHTAYKIHPRPGANKLFVGRLTDKLDEEALRNFFGKEAKKLNDAAEVLDVFIPKPFRGFAFVTVSNSEVAEKLFRINNFVIDGNSVVVSLAVPREEVAALNNASTSHQGYYADYGYSYPNPYSGKPAAFSPAALSPVYRDPLGYQPTYASPNAHHLHGPTFANSTPPRGQWKRPSRGGASSPAYPVPPQGTPIPGPALSPGVPYYKHPYSLPADSMQVGNQIASGLDALNLNQKNPELLNAAWNAFINTLQGGSHPSRMNSMSPMQQQHPPQNWRSS